MVLNTKKRNGRPSTCSTSKVCSDTIVPSSSTDRMAGAMTGTVMRSAVRSVLAPATREASSNAAFMLRKAGVEKDHLDRQGAGHDVDPDDAPERVDVERARAHERQRRRATVLTSPYSGSRSRIQLSVTVNGGRKKAAQNANSIQLAAGQVGAREQPGDEHRERQREELPREGDGERVPSAARRPGSPSAARQPSSP